MPNNNFKLRWLSGLLVGREFALPAGDLQFGGPDADVAVVLEADAQVLLTVDDEGVTVAPGAAVWVDGAPWSGEGQLPLGPVIDLAGQAFVLGRAGDTLPLLGVPARTSGADTLDTLERRDSGQALYKRWPLLLGGVSLLFVTAATVGAWWPPGGEARPFDARAWVDAQLKQPGLTDVRVTQDAQGSFIVSGRCAATADIDRLRQRMQEKDLLLRDDTVCADTVRSAVRQVLAANGYDDVAVEDGEAPASLVIRGDIRADRQWERASKQLGDVHGLQGWTVVNDDAASFDALVERLSQRGLLEGAAVTASSRTLWVTARVAPERERAFRSVVDEYNAQRGTRGLPAQFQNMAIGTSTAESLPAAIVGVGGNAGSIYIELANGMRVQKGAVLPSGYVVDALSRSWIVLRRAQRLISLRLDV